MLAVPYSQYERIKTFVLDYEAENLQEEFAADVTLSFSMPIDRIDEFDRALTELSMGALEAITFEIGELS
jgi:putative IMPACT (imprinted ancient) family translation regulator